VRRRFDDAFVIGEEQLLDGADRAAPEAKQDADVVASAPKRVSTARTSEPLDAALEPDSVDPASKAAGRHLRTLHLSLPTAAGTVGITAVVAIVAALALHGPGASSDGPVGSERPGGERVFAHHGPAAQAPKPGLSRVDPTSKAPIAAPIEDANGATRMDANAAVAAPTPAPVPAPAPIAPPAPTPGGEPAQPASPAVVQREFGP
jgi:hypothetical protein